MASALRLQTLLRGLRIERQLVERESAKNYACSNEDCSEGANDEVSGRQWWQQARKQHMVPCPSAGHRERGSLTWVQGRPDPS